jgi:hypothetical protein
MSKEKHVHVFRGFGRKKKGMGAEVNVDSFTSSLLFGF